METKKWYQSKTIWGIVISIIGYLVNKYVGVEGVSIPYNADFDQLEAYAQTINATKHSLPNLFGTLMSVFGFFLALFGRIKAETKIG